MNADNLHDYQWSAVDHILEFTHCGLMLDMGLGKTVSTLTAINRLIYEELAVTSVLIIAPKRVAEYVWSDEVEKWEHLRHLKLSKIIGPEKKRKAALKEKGDIYLVSRDNIAWLCAQYGGGMLPFDMLVVDESSSFKNHQSIRFKALRRVQPSFDRVVLLTGTPAPNGLIDLWAQMYLLDRGERLGKTIGQYRERYFKAGQSKGHVVYNYNIKTLAEDEIHFKISDICVSMKVEDYLKMPDKIDNVVQVHLPPHVMQQYKDFEREQIVELMAGEITAANAAALSNKLLQFANGAIYDEFREVHHTHDAKLDALEEIIEGANGHPVLVAWAYQHDRDRILQRLKAYKPVNFKTESHKNAWNAGEIQVMLMHPASGGHGLNLQDGGNRIVWFGNTWSLELEQQFNARLYRQGQRKRAVFIDRLVAGGTLDEDVIKALRNKDSKQEGLLRAIKSKAKQYGIESTQEQPRKSMASQDRGDQRDRQR